MTIEELLTQTNATQISLTALTQIAGDRRAFGDDIVAAFRTQVELRAGRMSDLLETAKKAERDLLASENREFDRLMRERDAIHGLLRTVETRGLDSYRPPAAVSVDTWTIDETGPVLARDQKLVDFVRRQHGGEMRAGTLRLGACIRALAFGDRRGLSEAEQRALSEGVDASGGFTVPTPLAAGFIDRLRAAAIVFRAGAQLVPMTSETLSIARLATGLQTEDSPSLSGPQWHTENEDISESGITLERVTFHARTLPVLVRMSVELQEDSNNIDAIIERELAAATALELDRAALVGSGVAPEPRGIANQSGVTITNLGATPTNLDFLVAAIGECWINNAEANYRVYNGSLASHLARLIVKPFSAATEGYPLIEPAALQAVPLLRSNSIPNAGTSPDTTSAIVGDFTQLMIGMRTSFRLEVSRVASDTFGKLQVLVRSYIRADVQLQHPEAFVVVTNVGL